MGPWASLYLPRAFTIGLHVVSTCECNCLESILVEHQGPTWEPGSHSSACPLPLNSPGPLSPCLGSLGAFTLATGHHLDTPKASGQPVQLGLI